MPVPNLNLNVDQSETDQSYSANSYGGVNLGGGQLADTGFFQAFYAANPAEGASIVAQSLASLPTWGYVAIAAGIVVLGVVLYRRR